MAAAYSAGAATSPTNLLQALVTFLTAQGWTTDASAADGAGWHAHLHKGAVYANFRAAVNESVWAAANINTGYSLNLYLGTGYAAVAWNLQAGGPLRNGGSDRVGVGVNLPSGAVVSHKFFDDGADNIVVVVERAAGVFGYLGFGTSINKRGQTWTGGPYFFGSCAGYRANYANTKNPGFDTTAGAPMNAGEVDSTASNDPFAHTFVRADVDAFTGLWLSGSNPPVGSTSATSGQSGYTGKVLLSPIDSQFNVTGNSSVAASTLIPSMDRLYGRLTAALNATAALLPIPLYAVRDDANAGLLGAVDSIYLADAVGQGYAAGDVVTQAGQDYMLFPYFAVYKGA